MKGRKMSYKVEIELDFDTYKPSGEDVFTYIKELYEDNSLNYKLINNKTEKEVTDAINAAASGRTMITIAHRMSSVERAGRVYKIENGCIELIDMTLLI